MGNNNKTKEKSNTSIIIIFIITVVSCGFLGYFTSALLRKLTRSKSTMDAIKGTLLDMAPYTLLFTIVINVIAMIAAFVFYNACVKLRKTMKDEDDYEILDKIETKLGMPLYIASILMIINLLLFTVNAYILLKLHVITDKYFMPYGIGMTATFFVSYIWETIIQSMVIKFEKELNPEKKGHILDRNFLNDWVSSCDEAQKITIYKAAYASYKATSISLYVMWMITLLGMLIFDQGIFATLCLSVIWLAQIISYSAAASKYEKEGLRIAE